MAECTASPLEMVKKYSNGLTVNVKAFFCPAGATFLKESAGENEEGSEFIISYLSRGDSFAVSVSEDNSESNKKAIASFTAIETTHISAISFNNKDMLAHRYDQWYKYILCTAVKYYSFYIELVDNIAFRKMDHRIAYFLSRLSKTKKTMLLQISHQEIADGLNSSREVVSRLLKKMEETGKIKLMHNSIKLIYL